MSRLHELIPGQTHFGGILVHGGQVHTKSPVKSEPLYITSSNTTRHEEYNDVYLGV